MSAAFLSDVTANLALAAQAGPITGYVAYAPLGTESLFHPIVAPGTRLVLADGSGPAPSGVTGFGRCLLGAIEAVLAQGHSAACVLNADSPNLPTSRLLEAAAALSQSDCIVMGAADDGGYYLLGMRRAHTEVFADIDWSTDRVAAQTRERAARAGLPLVELGGWYDVDDPGALTRLIADLAPARAGTCPAPCTAACIESLKLAERRPVSSGSIDL